MERSYYSTLFLTLLLLVGLVFFIRGSTKDRTTYLQLPDRDGSVTRQVRSFLLQQGYQIDTLEPDRGVITLKGQVQSSVFLAGLLITLSAVGLGCLSLVLSLLLPELGNGVWGLIVGAPLAGLFYWQGASRTEMLTLTARTTDGAEVLWIQGHRDTLRSIEVALQQNP